MNPINSASAKCPPLAIMTTETIPPVAKLPSTVKSATFKTLNVMKTPMAIIDHISARHIAPGNEDK